MPSVRISKDLNHLPHFLTLTVKRWYYVFDRHNRWQILYNSLKYCQKNKALKIFAWVFMLNHIHLIAQNQDLIGFVRDFKKYTSHQIMRNLRKTEPTVAKLFIEKNGRFSIWQKTNMPKPIETIEFMHQKIRYIENNPVRKGYVKHPEHWIWSSARYRYHNMDE